MQLKTVLNRVEYFRSWVHGKAKWVDDAQRPTIEVNIEARRLMREEFQRFREYCQPACTAKFLDEWCTRIMPSKIEPLQKVAQTLRRRRELILDWFRAKGTISAGMVEGLDKAKPTRRKADGFRTAKASEIALYQQLGDPPEPDVTHEFR